MRSKGLHYEEIALAHLRKAGLKLIARNYSCRYGEIDLIMLEENTLIFVEVRYRKSSRYGSAFESINPKKQNRIVKTAKHFIKHKKLWQYDCRFDAFAINGTNSETIRPETQWLQAAFNETF